MCAVYGVLSWLDLSGTLWHPAWHPAGTVPLGHPVGHGTGQPVGQRAGRLRRAAPDASVVQTPSWSGNGDVWVTVSPETARVRVTYRRRRPVRSSGSASTIARGSSRTT